MFPTVKLTILGCGFVVNPTLLEFIKHLPLHSWSSFGAQDTPPEGRGGMVGGSSAPLVHEGTAVAPAPLPYTLTPTVSVTEEEEGEGGEGQEGESKILSMARVYAVKVTYGHYVWSVYNGFIFLGQGGPHYADSVDFTISSHHHLSDFLQPAGQLPCSQSPQATPTIPSHSPLPLPRPHLPPLLPAGVGKESHVG